MLAKGYAKNIKRNKYTLDEDGKIAGKIIEEENTNEEATNENDDDDELSEDDR